MHDLDFDLPYREVRVPGSKTALRVRGLDFAAIVKIFNEFAGELDMIFQRFEGAEKAPSLDMDSVKEIGVDIIGAAPLLAAMIIMLASDYEDTPEVRSKFLKLPFPVQMEAFEEIMKLTFDGEDGPKKAVEAVIRAFQVSRGQIRNLRTSGIGSTVFGGK